MKFLYYGSFGPHNTESWIAHALKKQGHEVKCLPRNSYGASGVSSELSRNKYDVLLFTKTPPAFDLAIKTARKVGTTSVCWLFDLYWGWRKNVEKQSMWKADYVFTTDGGHEKQWESIGVSHETLRQGIHAPEYKKFECVKGYDVAFVGSAHYEHRKELFRFLKQNYNFLHIHNTRGINLNKKLAQVKVVVGDSVPSPHYWSNRAYEVTGRGGFLIHPEVKGFEEEFDTVPTFPHNDFDALRNLIDYYLENVNKREYLRAEQFIECGNYTYDRRVEDLCKHLSS